MYNQKLRIGQEKEVPIIPVSYGRGHVVVEPRICSLPRSIVTDVILKDVIIDLHQIADKTRAILHLFSSVMIGPDES